MRKDDSKMIFEVYAQRIYVQRIMDLKELYDEAKKSKTIIQRRFQIKELKCK